MNASPRRSFNKNQPMRASHKHKNMRKGHEPAAEIEASDSSDGSIAKRIYQGLEDEQDHEDGNPSQQ